MSVSIKPKTATVEQVAAQLLTILRRNETQEPAGGYWPRCVKSILAFEFTPQALGLDVRGGVIRLPGGGVAAFGGNYDPPAWLEDKYEEAVHWLREHGYIRRDRTQTSDQFVELTTEGRRVGIDPAAMTFVMPRGWTHWRSVYGDGVYQLSIRQDGRQAGGTAFLVGPRRFVTCAHNIVGTVAVYVGDAEVPVVSPACHPTADIAAFTVADDVDLPEVFLPIRSAMPLPGEEVAALGFPAVPLRQPTLNILVGAVESLPTDYRGDRQFIQVSFGSSGGVSGGPAIDTCGRVIGVVSERTFEQVADPKVPAKPFPQVVPISHLSEIAL